MRLFWHSQMRSSSIAATTTLTYSAFLPVADWCVQKLLGDSEQKFEAATSKSESCRTLGQANFQRQVSILGPVGYGPTTLPLRHAESSTASASMTILNFRPDINRLTQCYVLALIVGQLCTS